MPAITLEDMSPEQLRAVLGYPRNLARLRRLDGATAQFEYVPEPEHWPWLALPARHPVVLEKYQYFTGVTAACAFGDMAPGVRSALTVMRWSLGPDADDARYPTRGRCERRADADGGLSITVMLSDEAGADLARFDCRGQSFPDRDFASWRAGSRTAVQAADGIEPFHPAAPADGRPGFVSAARPLGQGRGVLARVAAAQGFHPAHPFHTGSGDHVNAAQLYDCALQAAEQLLGTAPALCLGGEAQFLRFVELDAGFEILLLDQAVQADGSVALSLLFRQGGRDNARIALELGS